MISPRRMALGTDSLRQRCKEYNFLSPIHRFSLDYVGSIKLTTSRDKYFAAEKGNQFEREGTYMIKRLD